MLISELFKSLQGEGRNQGRPCIFIRLSGCNLNCAWCDTPYARTGGRALSVHEICEKVGAFTGTMVCITGGEPLLQGEELIVLVKNLADSGRTVEIETNGTIDFRPFQPYATICMDVKCPSSGESSDLSLLQYIRDQDSVKFVIKDLDDGLYAEQVIRHHLIAGEIFITPVWGSDASNIARFVMDHALPARFQLQLHKIIGVR
jgi:7-carboxy-7-deazaguanine synthase